MFDPVEVNELLKGKVRGKLPKDPDAPVLVDWSGKFAEAYAFVKGAATVVVFDPRGHRVAYRTVYDMDEAVLASLVSAVQQHGLEALPFITLANGSLQIALGVSCWYLGEACVGTQHLCGS